MLNRTLLARTFSRGLTLSEHKIQLKCAHYLSIVSLQFLNCLPLTMNAHRFLLFHIAALFDLLRWYILQERFNEYYGFHFNLCFPHISMKQIVL